MMEKPRGEPREAKWLEVPDAARLLDAARTLPVAPNIVYPWIATFLLTGGRSAEILGLETADVSFDRKTVTILGDCLLATKSATIT